MPVILFIGGCGHNSLTIYIRKVLDIMKVTNNIRNARNVIIIIINVIILVLYFLKGEASHAVSCLLLMATS